MLSFTKKDQKPSDQNSLEVHNNESSQELILSPQRSERSSVKLGSTKSSMGRSKLSQTPKKNPSSFITGISIIKIETFKT